MLIVRRILTGLAFFFAVVLILAIVPTCRIRLPRATVSLAVDVPDLDHFVHHPETLERALLTMPSWKGRDMWDKRPLFTFSDASVDVRHPLGPGGGIEIWHPEYVFYFSSHPPVDGGVRGPDTIIAPLAGTARVGLTVDHGTYNSTVAIGGPGLWFTFFERTEQKERARTEAALGWLAGFLATVRAHEAEIDAQGFSPALSSSDTVRRGPPSFALETPTLSPEEAVDEASAHNVDAWLNGGAPGAVEMKAFNEATGREMTLYPATRARLGWSADPAVVFRYKTGFAVRKGASYGRYPARFELWFEPESGAPRKVFEKRDVVQGWVR